MCLNPPLLTTLKDREKVVFFNKKNSLPANSREAFLITALITLLFPVISPLCLPILPLLCVFACVTERKRGADIGWFSGVSMVIKQDVVSDLLPRQARV